MEENTAHNPNVNPIENVNFQSRIDLSQLQESIEKSGQKSVASL